jgi:hypothetical protein
MNNYRNEFIAKKPPAIAIKIPDVIADLIKIDY